MALRPVTQGLYHRQGWNPSSVARALTSGVIEDVGWRLLQSSAGGPNGPILHPNPIDDMLALIAGDPNGLKLKIRVGAAGGQDHPSWVVADCGTADMCEPRDNRFPCPSPIVCWWKPAYINHYTNLIEKLRLEYDNIGYPDLLEFTMSLGRTFYMEVFIRQVAYTVTVNGVTTWPNGEALLDAGYTPALDNAARLAGIEAYAGFTDIRTSIALSGNQYYDPVDRKGKHETVNNSSFTVKAGRHMRKVLGRRAVLGNNAYTSPLKAPVALYDFIESMGAPIYYQTENPVQLGLPGPGGELKATRVQSMDVSRNSMIELPGSYKYASIDKATGLKNPDDTLTDDELSTWDADLYTHATETTPGAPGSFTATVASSSQVDFTWTYPSTGLGIIEIRIYQDGVLKKTVDTYPNDKKTSASVTGLAAGTTSTWLARAFNGVESVDSNTQIKTTSGTPTGDTNAPDPGPVITSATENANGGVALAWSAATDANGIARYGIEHNGVEIDSVTGTTLAYTHTSPDRGVLNSYVVRAYDPSGNSTPSTAVSVAVSAGEEPVVVVTGWQRARRKPWT